MDFTKLNGLIPAVIQDDSSGDVLMVGFMNQDALDRTIATGFATFYSRTRATLWTKGETSGNRLSVTSILTDCDEDTVLVKVTRLGDGHVCHTGAVSCFFRTVPHEGFRTTGSAQKVPHEGFRTGGSAQEVPHEEES